MSALEQARLLDVSLPFGAGWVTVTLPATATVLRPPATGDSAATSDGRAVTDAVRAATGLLTARLDGARLVTVCVTDATRPTPLATILPGLLSHVRQAAPGARICLVVATGLHPAAAGEPVLRSIEALLGEHGVDAVVHDAYAPDLVEVGSVAGQPVLVNRWVAAADCVLAVGTVAAHAEAGYSGGAKALIPGCAGAELIRSLHAIPTGPTEWRGALADNPFRGFLEAAAALVPNLLCLNVVLHPDGAVAAATLDDPIAAHRRMSHEFASRYTYPRPAPADLVVVSGGGRPFDSDLHQVEGKAWRVGGDVIADGAHLLLIGECPNGLGSPELRAALDGGSSRSLRHAQRKLAFLSAAVARCARVDVLHGEHPELARLSRLGLRRTRSAQHSIDRGLAALGPDATVLVIPSPPYVVWSSAPSPRRKVMS